MGVGVLSELGCAMLREMSSFAGQVQCGVTQGEANWENGMLLVRTVKVDLRCW